MTDSKDQPPAESTPVESTPVELPPVLEYTNQPNEQPFPVLGAFAVSLQFVFLCIAFSHGNNLFIGTEPDAHSLFGLYYTYGGILCIPGQILAVRSLINREQPRAVALISIFLEILALLFWATTSVLVA